MVSFVLPCKGQVVSTAHSLSSWLFCFLTMSAANKWSGHDPQRCMGPYKNGPSQNVFEAMVCPFVGSSSDFLFGFPKALSLREISSGDGFKGPVTSTLKIQ